jgi:predicted dehydrogenase
MDSSSKELRIGILGAGGFSRFSVDAFLKVHGVTISGVHDINPLNAETFSKKFNCRIFKSQKELLEDSGTDIIYITTPPNLHYRHSKDSLRAGKHVICEKPAAFKQDEVKELITLAEEKQLLYVINLMQRYNPLFEKVRNIVHQKILGDFLHGYFENYASDENLGIDHWMWNEDISGGIFIEHAVHFFDLFEGWFGEGKVIASQKIRKPDQTNDIWSEVMATCKYNKSLVNFYHGFHQPNRMDRQELKLVFELGDITLTEWVPTTLKLHGLVNEKEIEKIKDLFPGEEEEIRVIREFDKEEKAFRSNFKDRSINFEIIFKSGKFANKYKIYAQILTDMLADQVSWLTNRNYQRVITGDNGLNSVKMSEAAEQMAVKL